MKVKTKKVLFYVHKYFVFINITSIHTDKFKQTSLILIEVDKIVTFNHFKNKHYNLN